jgi:hypothetical protein
MQIENESVLDNTASSEADAEAEAEQAESETVENADESDDSDEGDDAPKKSKKIQKRIDEITKARREAERERDFWRSQAEKQAKAEYQQYSVGQKPTLEQFDYDQEQYLEALADYKLQSKLAENQAQVHKQQVNQQELQEVQQFKQREYEVMSEFPDYQQKVYANDVPITDTMAKAIRIDENGARVAYFLASYKDIAYRIANMTPREQFLAIGDISEKISQATETSGAGKVSKAPSPVPSVSTRGGAVSKSPDKMSMDEWMKWRSKQLSKR